jgi:hypothetical protein
MGLELSRILGGLRAELKNGRVVWVKYEVYNVI